MLSSKFLTGMIFVVLSLLSQDALSQESPQRTPSHFRGGAGYLELGAKWLQMDSLSDRLVAAGFSEPDKTSVLIGGGGQRLLGRFLLGGEGFGLIGTGSLARRGELRANLSGGYGLFRAGYALFRSERLDVSAMAGFGGMRLNLEISREGDVPFDDVISNPTMQTSLSIGGMLFDAALAVDCRLPVGGGEDTTQFLLLGLRGGYSYAPLGDDWETRGGEALMGPDLNLSGPDIRLVIGFGWLKR